MARCTYGSRAPFGKVVVPLAALALFQVPELNSNELNIPLPDCAFPTTVRMPQEDRHL